MLPCPHYLPRSRVCAGLPVYNPQHRLRLGRRREGPQDARSFVDNAPQSNTSSQPDTFLNGVRHSSVYSTVIPEMKTQRLFHTTTFGRSAGNSVLCNQPSIIKREFSLLSPGAASRNATLLSLINKNTTLSVVQKRSLRTPPTLASFSDVKPLLTLRFGKETKALDLAIRSGSYTCSGDDIRKWRFAQRELFQAKYDGREVQEELVPYPLDSKDKELLETIQTDSLGAFREAWNGLTPLEMEIHWGRLSLWLLRNSPELALEFLLVTCQASVKPVFAMIADCLIYLDTLHSREMQRWTKNSHNYQYVIRACLDPMQWPVSYVPQKGVRFFIKKADRSAVYEAWDLVETRRHRLKGETYLGFMGRFTEFKDVDNALLALRRAGRQFWRLHQSPMEIAVSRHCSKLLVLDSVVDGPDGRNFRILPELLSMGVQPDRDMMNVVLSNAFKTGDPQLGLDVLRHMKAQGFQLDSYTYLTLLSDAVARQDRERMTHLMEELESQPELKKNPYIASKLFHSHFVFNVKHLDGATDRREIFYSLLRMYCELHDITPLKELSIVPRQYDLPTTGEKTPPSVIALYLVIATWLRCQAHVGSVERVYTRFRELVLQGHKDIAPLAATDHTYNEFMLAYRNNPHGLRPAVRVVEDMLQSATEAGAKTGSSESTFTQTQPTVLTWTLLLSAFIYNNQPLAAEKVREMMAKHGVVYSMTTWNVIISGFASQQNASAIAQSIKDLEDQGLSIDAYTMKGLRYLRDPEQLWIAVEQLDLKSASHLRRDAFNPNPESPQLDEAETEQLLDRGLQRLKANA